MQKLKKHLGYYTVLLLIAGMGLFLMTRPIFDSQIRMLLVVLIAFFYVLWGVLHHFVHHDLTAKIMLEYVLVGALGITLIFFLIK